MRERRYDSDMYNFTDIKVKNNNNNKSTGKTIAIVILVILLLCSIAYISYNELIKIKDTNKTEEKKAVRKDMYYSEVADLLDQIDMYNHVFKSEYPIKDINSIDNQYKLQFGIYALQKINDVNNYYTEDDLEDVFKNYFVDNFSVVYENVRCPSDDGDLYILDNDTKKFTMDENHEHSMPTVDIKTYYVSSEITGNKYVIDTNILYGNYCNGTCQYSLDLYKSYDDAVKGDFNAAVMNSRQDYREVADTLPITRFTFIKDKSHYKLKSVDVIEE